MNLDFQFVKKGIPIGIGVGIAIVSIVLAFAAIQSTDTNQDSEGPLEPQQTGNSTPEPGKTFTLELSDGAGTTDGTP